MKACVVTGVSSGIGEAIARDLAANGWHVFGTVRSEADAVKLETDLGDRFTALPADVTDAASLVEAAEDVAEALNGAPLAGLVCNAGVSLPGPLLLQPLEELDRQWNVNVRGLVATIQAFGPLLGAREGFFGTPGRIVTMSSVSGKLSWPFVGGYAASKHAVEAVSHSLRRELMPFGVDVVIVGPGPIATPIWEKSAKAVDVARYANSIYGPILGDFEKAVADRKGDSLAPGAVADVVRAALTVEHPKTRYVVTKNALKNFWLPINMPDRMLDRFVARVMGLGRKT